MTIATILKEKGGAVFTIFADLSLQQATVELERKRVGAVVVVDTTGAIAGVLSERDIIRQVARRGTAALQETVGATMTRNVITVTRLEAIDAALARMTDRRIRHLPVVESEKLIGIISIGDLVKAKIAQAEAEAAAMKDYLHSGG